MDWQGIVKTVPDRRGRDTLASGFRAGLIEAPSNAKPGPPNDGPIPARKPVPRETPAMTAATFDTLTIARELEAAGVERRQAEAIAGAVRQAVSADRDELATKADLAGVRDELRADLAGLEARMYRALWIQAAALIGTQLAIAGFVVHLLSQP